MTGHGHDDHMPLLNELDTSKCDQEGVEPAIR
jgi:hypothetical protein